MLLIDAQVVTTTHVKIISVPTVYLCIREAVLTSMIYVTKDLPKYTFDSLCNQYANTTVHLWHHGLLTFCIELPPNQTS